MFFKGNWILCYNGVRVSNKMRLNSSKPKVIRITCSKIAACSVYQLNDVNIQVVSETKYLGVTIVNRLT